MPTVAGLFRDRSAAEVAVQDLLNNGFSRNDISLLASDTRGEHTRYEEGDTDAEERGKAATTSAIGGGILGGTLGLLLSAGALTIPGIGPVLAAGPLAASLGALGGTLTGAGVGVASGSILGALIGSGISEQDAHHYSEGIRRGGTLVLVTTDEARDSLAHSMMRGAGAMEIHTKHESGDHAPAPVQQREYGASASETAPYDQDWRESSKIGTTAGATAGAATGAAIGSAVGPLGTLVGGAVGAALGSVVGAAGDVAGQNAEKESERKADKPHHDDENSYPR